MILIDIKMKQILKLLKKKSVYYYSVINATIIVLIAVVRKKNNCTSCNYNNDGKYLNMNSHECVNKCNPAEYSHLIDHIVKFLNFFYLLLIVL